MRQQVVIVVADGASFFELATPIGVWGRDRSGVGGPAIDLHVCSLDGSVTTAGGPALLLGGVEPLDDRIKTADVVVVPTWPIGETEIPDALCRRLIEARDRGARLVGLCTGAFVLAQAGALDGLSAVTHWQYHQEFAQRYPTVTLERDPLYIDHGSVITSAGSAAALDCCLHIVRSDHGAEAAAIVARSMVTAPHRSGGQSQFAAAPTLRLEVDDLGRAMSAAVDSIDQIASVTQLAVLAAMSRRTLERAFRDRVGLTPRAWLTEQRVTAARRLLEQTSKPIDVVATESGLGSAPTLRREFRRALGTTPTAYRHHFQALAPE